MSTTTMAAAGGDPTSSPAPKSDSSPTNSPLLFFVALGFGVVFTNLWIIVGVKYCFRYNQRNRQLRNEDTGEPIDLVPQTHRRRRREKKLMTMEEVNGRFPLMKYKAWRASRADEGLPTAGGIQAPGDSRPASIKNEGDTMAPSNLDGMGDSTGTALKPQFSVDSTSLAPTSSVSADGPKATPQEPEPASKEEGTITERYQPSKEISAVSPSTHDDSDDDEYDHIQNAIPTELLNNPGDSCAVCLDILEDDDDVRGLTCGHAFHASCIDPWLTSRKACCPLCKADYYVPKPRAEGAADPGRDERHRRAAAALHGPTRPDATYNGNRSHPLATRLALPGRFMTAGPPDNRHGRASRTRDRGSRPNRQRPPARANPSNDATNRNGPGSWRSRLPNLELPRASFPRFNLFSRNRQATDQSTSTTTGPAQPEPTPGQLEAGRT